MKILLFLAVFLINFSILKSEDKWINVLENAQLLPVKIICTDSMNCVFFGRSGNYGKIYYSSNGGFNWNLIFDNNGSGDWRFNPENIAYPHFNSIFLLARNENLVIKYNNAGKALDSFNLDASYTHSWTQHRDREIMMSDTLVGLANIGNRVYLTKDGWKTYKIITPDISDTSVVITSIHIKDENNFSFYHRNRNYYFTIDGGETFEIIPIDSGVNVWDIYFLNNDIGYIIAHRFNYQVGPVRNTLIFKTIDNGKSWDIILDTIIAPEMTPGAYQIHMLDENVGTLVGGHGVIAMTDDGWKTFKRVFLPRTSIVSYSSIAYSGNRPIIAIRGNEMTSGDIFTLIDSVYMNIGAPELISPTDLSKGLLVDVTFRWTKVNDITKYVFQLAKDDKFTQIIHDNTLEVSEMQTSLRWDVSGLENCTDYYWRAASLKEQTIKWSPTYTFRTRLEQGEQITPEDNTIEITSDTTLSWHPLNNAERYHLQLSLDSQYNNLIFSQDTLRSTEHRIVDLPDKSLIYWRVRGYCFAGFGQWSPTRHFTTMNKASVSEPISVSFIHPNPASEYITIQTSEVLETSEVSGVQIINTLGECVIELADVQHLGDVGHLKRIDVSNLPRGVYYVRIGSRTQMFVKV
ncbi:MAG: hypothetical protein CVV22_09620 [Ignavibacteriae bacterium HGW-Ignavibacteriae-1]|jgi:photosystem II stability/assembly factor-like uncharacterized protein|nr:MAG: hypothetical protein CVV22_09620 [Ignavibacteriae bacterium HGW-Ignavibacteriae-1]